MEDNMLNLLDDLEIEEAERLLDGEVNIDINKKSKARIRRMVFKKAGFRTKQYFIPRKLVACVAAAALLMTLISVVGVDQVKAAISHVFSFIPGFGIVENNDNIKYILSDTVTTENEKAILTLKSAVATKDSITVMFTLQRKNYSEEQLIKDKQEEWEQLKKNDRVVHPNVSLYANGKEYTDYSGTTASGGIIDTFSLTYILKQEKIYKEVPYQLVYADFGLTLEFTLKDYETYSELNQIGATGYHNNISLTAVPTFIGEQVEVSLYAINKSQYRIISYHKINHGYGGRDLNLVTNSGTKSYSLADVFGGTNLKYIFNVNPTDTTFTLNIPYAIVQSSENQTISLPIPKEDEEIDVNKKVKFKDSTMTIVSVKKVDNGTENGSLMLNIDYENKQSNLIMCQAMYRRINFWGTPQGGSYSATYDKDDIETTVYINLEKGDEDALRLEVSDPQYYMTDGYCLEFDRN